MALELVTVTVRDDQIPGQPVPDVLVRVYDSTGTSLLTWGMTGQQGVVEFMLEGTAQGRSYQLRFSKTGDAFQNPYSIQVTSPPESTPLAFSVSAQTQRLPLSPDPLYCRCSGYFVDPSGRPMVGMSVTFYSRQTPTPQLLGSGDSTRAVLGRRTVMTDRAGYVSVDLPRNAEFEVVIGAQENAPGVCAIPDAPAASLVHVLYPQVGEILYDPAGPLALSVGDSSDVDLEIIYTSGVRTFTGPPPVAFVSSDEDVATALYSGNHRLTVTAVGPGECSITPQHVDGSGPAQLPGPPDLAALVVHVD